MRRAMNISQHPIAMALGASFLVAACATPPQIITPRPQSPVVVQGAPLPIPAPVASVTPQTATEKPSATSSEAARKVFMGTGTLMKPPVERPASPGGDVRFNFEQTDIREVVKSILGDTLQENYVVDGTVNGNITLRTNKGIARADLVPTLEVMLRQVNAVLVKDGNLWRVQPAASGLRGIARPNVKLGAANGGYGLTLVPLKYIGVNEMMRMLDSIVKEPAGQAGSGGSARPEPLRNMIMLTGTPAEVQYLLDTIEMFDVDWMSGMSVGLFTLEHSEAKKVVEEVDKLFGGLTQGTGQTAQGGPMFGLVRVQLIERLNALLVISPQRHIIEQAETWIRRLDRAGNDAGGQSMYVYNLQYTSAEKLAPVLQQAMQGRATTTTTTPAASTAPGQNVLSIQTPQVGTNITTPPAPTPAPTPRPAGAPAVGAGGAAGGTALARNATIIADKDRNALLIVATPAEFTAIEAAIKKLDVLPRQVMVEVTVIEVDLTDDFALGVEWKASRDKNGGESKKDVRSGTLGNAGLTFSLARKDLVGSILEILDVSLTAKDNAKRARIHASPKLMAIDNTPVKFNVGRSVSVQTSSVSTPGTTVTTNSVSNNYQYLQTGISVSITPRISAGGLVHLDITQEISEPVVNSANNANGSNPNPDISKTALQNTVIAQNGETIVMAGLIREKIGDGTSGIPGASRIPFFGALFGQQIYNTDKQEILVLVRPVVVNSIDDARVASDEMRNKMLLLRDTFGANGIGGMRPLVQPDPNQLKISPSLNDGSARTE
jgi:general secretion pathway protein D